MELNGFDIFLIVVVVIIALCFLATILGDIVYFLLAETPLGVMIFSGVVLYVVYKLLSHFVFIPIINMF